MFMVFSTILIEIKELEAAPIPTLILTKNKYMGDTNPIAESALGPKPAPRLYQLNHKVMK